MAANKVEINGQIILDLTIDSVTPDAMLESVTAHNAAGELITGQLKLGAYNITTTDNEDGSQNLIITDAAGGGGSSGSKTVTFSGADASSPVVITYVSNGTMQRLSIGGGTGNNSVEITVDSNTSIHVTTTGILQAFYPTVSGVTLLPGAIQEESGKTVIVEAMYKLD